MIGKSGDGEGECFLAFALGWVVAFTCDLLEGVGEWVADGAGCPSEVLQAEGSGRSVLDEEEALWTVVDALGCVVDGIDGEGIGGGEVVAAIGVADGVGEVGGAVDVVVGREGPAGGAIGLELEGAVGGGEASDAELIGAIEIGEASEEIGFFDVDGCVFLGVCKDALLSGVQGDAVIGAINGDGDGLWV